MSAPKHPGSESEQLSVLEQPVQSRRKFLMAAGVAAAAAAAACTKEGVGLFSPGGPAFGKSAAKTKMDTPTISCGESTEVSINLVITAGATGAPAGFSIQWMTAADYAANADTWYASDDLRLCKASFSGNANDSRYALAPGASVSVNIGELLFDNGTSTNCAEGLVCGTAYVFRAFAHATSALTRSDFTANRTCSTLACSFNEDGDCTYTQGYWKSHGPIPLGNNSNEWPVTSLMLGTVSYTDLELLSIFNTPASGNGLITLAHQLIAAKLNAAKGATTTAIDAAITAADAMIGGLKVPPVGAGTLLPASTGALVTALANYNEGATGPGHC